MEFVHSILTCKLERGYRCFMDSDARRQLLMFKFTKTIDVLPLVSLIIVLLITG